MNSKDNTYYDMIEDKYGKELVDYIDHVILYKLSNHIDNLITAKLTATLQTNTMKEYR